MWLVIHSVYRFILHFIANVGSHTFSVHCSYLSFAHNPFRKWFACHSRLTLLSVFIFIIFYDFIDAKESIPCEKKAPETSQQKL